MPFCIYAVHQCGAPLLKKRLWYMRFPVNFAKFLRSPFLTEHFQWLLLSIRSFKRQIDFSFWHSIKTFLLKELRNRILCIIPERSLFCSVRIYKGQHFLPTLLLKLGFCLFMSVYVLVFRVPVSLCFCFCIFVVLHYVLNSMS